MLYELIAHNGLLFADDLRPHVSDPRSLARDVDRGLLVKLRRGAYVDGDKWRASSSRERYLLRIRAVVGMSERPLVLSGVSAAAVWGMPVENDWPHDVFVADSWRGGGRSEPGIRVSAAGFPTARVVELDGLQVTDLARTALCVARGARLMDCVGSLDWATWRKNESRVSIRNLTEDLETWHPRTGYWSLRKAVEFSTNLSDSFGESRARAAIHLAGYEKPELQAEFRDQNGEMVVDFHWRRARIVVEFDGKVKYTRGEFTDGDPSEIVWREKKRQDRLRRLSLDVERLTSYETEHPDILKRILDDVGVPRRG